MVEHINYSISEQWADYHEVLRSAIMNLVAVVQAQLNREQIKVLDVGCGRGELLAGLQSRNTVPFGIDMDKECVRLSKQYVGRVTVGDIASIPNHYENEYFELVIASHILEHLDNPRKGVEFLKAATKKYLIIAVPNLSQFVNLSWLKKSPGFVNKGHQLGWDAAHLNTFLTYTCGLEVLCWQPDRVLLHSRFVKLARLLGIERKLQDSILPRLFPLQSRSLIVLCAKK